MVIMASVPTPSADAGDPVGGIPDGRSFGDSAETGASDRDIGGGGVIGGGISGGPELLPSGGTDVDMLPPGERRTSVA
ncbi:MAG: hypothetical protein CMH41_02445 [Micrococcales bacterium]|nr:hypothetical protein [Micrococcales bacterium]